MQFPSKEPLMVGKFDPLINSPNKNIGVPNTEVIKLLHRIQYANLYFIYPDEWDQEQDAFSWQCVSALVHTVLNWITNKKRCISTYKKAHNLTLPST